MSSPTFDRLMAHLTEIAPAIRNSLSGEDLLILTSWVEAADRFLCAEIDALRERVEALEQRDRERKEAGDDGK